MVTTITVNNQRNAGGRSSGKAQTGGQPQETKGDKKIIGELKKLGNFFKKESRTSASGIFGAGGLLKGAGGLLALGALGLLGAASATGSTDPRATAERTQETSFEKALIDGQESVVEVDRKTGDIVRILTKQEAIDQNILDSKGNIVREIDVSNRLWDESTKGLASYKDSVIINTENINEIAGLTEIQKQLFREINEQLKEQLNQARKEKFEAEFGAGVTPGDVLGLGLGPISGETYRGELSKELTSGAKDNVERIIFENLPTLNPANFINLRR